MNLKKKSLGQNFLIDKNIVNKILFLIIKIKIFEIGSGKGALTDTILKKKSLILLKKILIYDNLN